MATLAEMLRQGSFENPNNPYSSNLLADALRGSLSNAESLGRGVAVAPLGIFGDVNALAREYITPRLPAKVQAALESLPAAPTTEAILAQIPRGTEARRESSGMEQLGAAMNPMGPIEAAKGVTKGLGAYGKLAGEAINDAMVYGRGPLAEVTPQPMRLDVWHGSPHKLPSTESNLFGEFDASKIGTGAGAQARGYGIYSSESPEFADYFAIKKGIPDLEGIASQNGIQLSNDARIELMRQATKDISGKPAKGDNYIDPIAAVRKLQSASIEARQLPAEKLQNTIREFQNQNKAYLYKADLPDEMIPKMLDLDKPIKDQPEALKAIRSMIDDADILKTFDHNVSKGITGENAAINYVRGKTPAEKSEALRNAGIPGNVYKELDTRNFVIFPGAEKSMKILERKER